LVTAARLAITNGAEICMATGNFGHMSSSNDGGKTGKDLKDVATDKARDPEWASSLKKLYNSVVDEPLPDSFTSLLSKLDEDGGK
jgi:hypothetical protein